MSLKYEPASEPLHISVKNIPLSSDLWHKITKPSGHIFSILKVNVVKPFSVKARFWPWLEPLFRQI